MQNSEEKTQKHILAIDDNPVMLSTLKTIVSNAGYKLSAAMTGDAALRYLNTHNSPDLMLLDVEMPDMSGYDLIKKIKSNAATSHIPVIFLTARNDDDNELKGLTLGAIDYISKTTPPQLLLKRIEVHLLVESQKQQLIDFNNNLQQMVDERTKTVTELKNTILKTMAGLWSTGMTLPEGISTELRAI